MTRGESTKILLVEDDPTQAMMYQQEFVNAGYAVIMAETGQLALQLAATEEPDLIFLDMVLSDMSGMDILRSLKSDSRTKDIKVVILSNLQKKELADEARSHGALDFLVKMQFIPKDIVNKAEKYLEGGQ